MPIDSVLIAGESGSAGLASLVQLFPNATPVRMAVLVYVGKAASGGENEKTTIEFSTSRVVLFPTNLTLEIDDPVHLRNTNGSFAADAVVIAVQYNERGRAVAARFAAGTRHWIVQD